MLSCQTNAVLLSQLHVVETTVICSYCFINRYERGYISMLDTNGGDVIRRLPDAHAPQSAVLHLR